MKERFDDKKHVPDMASNSTFTSGYLQEVKGDLDGPPCHVCGAIMVLVRKSEPLCTKVWECLSCGTTTGCS